MEGWSANEIMRGICPAVEYQRCRNGLGGSSLFSTALSSDVKPQGNTWCDPQVEVLYLGIGCVSFMYIFVKTMLTRE